MSPMFGRATITSGIGPHSSLFLFLMSCQQLYMFLVNFRLSFIKNSVFTWIVMFIVSCNL